MSRLSPTSARLFALAPLALLCSGCIGPGDKAKELERVAKDWCLTIRASQVIPVYPLTRDIWPGDVFLTTTPIGEEVALFEQKGFLPLDIHLKRLPTNAAIKAFYSERLADGNGFPGTVSQWTDLPASAFPTYSFGISRSGGLNIALPVEGVPVGFDLLHTAAATGTVTLAQTRTVGLDIDSVRPLLEQWEKANRGLLAGYATTPSDEGARPVFLRVVTRVYQAKAVTVSLADASAGGAEVAAGVELPKPEPGTPDASKSAAELYAELAAKLNATPLGQVGGKARFLSVSRRSVSMREDFAEPLTVGYLAYDCQILPGGLLTLPVPTLQRLEGSPLVTDRVFNPAALILAWYTADEQTRVPLIKAWMRDHLAGDGAPSDPVEFLSKPKWELEQRRMIRDLGIIPR